MGEKTGADLCFEFEGDLVEFSPETTAVLDQLADLPNTKWETGRVSGAVYHGGEEMGHR
jgi:hypothetical protein